MIIGRDRDAYIEELYKILKEAVIGLDAIYEEYIINLIGTTGLMALHSNSYLETCGVVNGRQLYALCCEGES